MTSFVRLVGEAPERKGSTLRKVVSAVREGHRHPLHFEVAAEAFRAVPGSPAAYWVSDEIRAIFARLEQFQTGDRSVRQGLATADDFRFLRTWWEVSSDRSSETRWRPLSKGGNTNPFYADIDLVIAWGPGERALKAFRSAIRNPTYYFQPGYTYTLRAARFAPQVLPHGVVISTRGSGIYVGASRMDYLGLMCSTPADRLLKLMLGRDDHPQFDMGDIALLPVPDSGDLANSGLSDLARDAWALTRSKDRVVQTSHAFGLPALLQERQSTIEDALLAWSEVCRRDGTALSRLRHEIDEMAFSLYQIDGEDRRQMEEGFGTVGSAEEEADPSEHDDEDEVEGTDPVTLTESLLEWALGTALGRFDVRLATGERQPSPDPGPFDPLPVCSPGMLQEDDGLPAREAPAGYPLDLPPHGMLVDDPGHPWDVVARIEAVFDLVAGDLGHAWIQEAEGILGRDLRDWLRRYGFERHLKRYSRSRRKAPLFWHLAPKSREYGIWLYSTVATRDTFYRIQNDYLDPKLKAAERRLLELRQHAGASPTGQQRKDLTAQESLVEELRSFREQVALVAPLWRPFRDDGVVLNCAVLSHLFEHHRVWQKECAKKWSELADGKYDWAGWAMHLWPERVVATCASDRSIAIAHGLEEALWREDEDGKWEPRLDADEEIVRLIAERGSPAVEAALDAYERAG